MTNALDILGKRYMQSPTTGYQRGNVIIGAPYLVTRDWSDAHVVIARKSTGKGIIELNGRNWYATLVDPPVKVGDWVYALERAEHDQNIRRDRRREVIAVTDEGVMTQYPGNNPILVTHWVMAEEATAPERDRYNPDRRKIVIDRLSKEGMTRIGDTGYAISAREFFTHFDLPKPEINATAFLDVERVVGHNDMDYSLSGLFDEDSVTSLRKAALTGRAKVTLPKGACRCKEVTLEEAVAAWGRSAQRWKVVKMHKVQCLWCMPDKEAKEAVARGEF